MEYHPSIVSWNVTSACNLRCPHCYIDAGRRRPSELSTEEGLRLIDQMAEAGTELLILTGGEPLLRKDLPVLARRATAKGIAVVLGTTGTLINRERARELKASGVAAAGISIDSVDEAKHDAFRGIPGAWQRAVRGIRACREEGLDVLVHTTALKMNRRQIPALVDFAYDKEARAFHLFFLVCTGRGERLTDLSPQEYESLLHLVLDIQERYPNMMVRARCAPYIGRLAMERGVSAVGSAGCLAGTSYCRITPTGDVTPCPYLPTPAGNVRTQGFGQLWQGSPVLARFRLPQRRLQGKCGECPLSQGDNPICVGCRARALALAGDEMAADPWCLYEPGRGSGSPEKEATPRREKKPATQVSIPWAEDALKRVQHVPFFIRGRVKQSAEAFVRREGLPEVTTEVLSHLRQKTYGKAMPGHAGGECPVRPSDAKGKRQNGQ